MSLPISAIVPVTATANAGAVETGLVFRPGTLVDARVLQVGSDGLAKILISGAVIEALSEATLVAGGNLRLAVSTSPEGVRLTIVPQDAQSTPAQAAQPQAAASTAGAAGTTEAARAGAKPLPVTPEAAARAALSQAVTTAATRQTSLSPLFANLSAALGRTNLPPQVAQAAMALLALRLPLDERLSGEDVRQAALRSGTFLESRLAAGQSVGSGSPDIKASLTALRQALVASFGQQAVEQAGGRITTPQQAQPQANAAGRGGPGALHATSDPAVPATGQAVRALKAGISPDAALKAAPPESMAQARPSGGAALVADRGIAPPRDGAASVIAMLRGPPAPASPQPDGDVLIPVRIVAAPSAALAPPPRHGLNALLGLIAGLFETEPQAQGAQPLILRSAQPAALSSETQAPPPLRGQPPAAQPVAAASLSPDMSPDEVGRMLLKDTEGALARQVLLQAASLSDRPEGMSPRMDTVPTRVQFEIPFVTPQGTAMAHFEIAEEEGGKGAADAADKAWQARFTIATEPAGPVHVLVTLKGQHTSVRMWAEREETAARLADDRAGLSQALSRAELTPGDISVAEGAPPRRPAAGVGHFLDRAT